ATGQTHSVREFIQLAGRALGMEIEFKGKDINERGINRKTGKEVVRVNPQFYRPAEVDKLQGNFAKADQFLGWRSTVSFAELVNTMSEADDRRVRDQRVPF